MGMCMGSKETRATGMPRRAFVGAGGLVAAGALTAGLSGLPAIAAEASVKDGSSAAWDREVDVVVCGCGTGGVPAALDAFDAGCEVLVLEKKDWLGGQLRRCGGGVAGAGTKVQKALGVEDSADDFYKYWVACGGDRVVPELIRPVADMSASIVDWIIDDLGGQPVEDWAFSGGEDGLEYSSDAGLNIGTDPSTFAACGMKPVARCHWFTANPDDPFVGDDSKFLFPTAGGTGLWRPFGAALEQRGVEVLTKTPLVRLVTRDDGADGREVIGVVAECAGKELRIKARRGAVVATGNFGSNHEMFKNYILRDYEENAYGALGIDIAGENDGSGIRAARALGAELLFPAFAPPADSPYVYSMYLSGLRTDTKARALDVFGKPIPRLHITGMAAGGFIGEAYPSCGCSVVRCLAYGRIAGQELAASEPWE